MKKPFLMQCASFFRLAMMVLSVWFAGWCALRLFLSETTPLQGLVVGIVFVAVRGVIVGVSMYLSVLMVPWSVQSEYAIAQMRGNDDKGAE